MNFSQLHEQLRLELLRRIERGVLTVTLLARQTRLKPSHISNFLHRKRNLSQSALDRVLDAQALAIENLLPVFEDRGFQSKKSELLPQMKIPLVSQSIAMYEAQVRASSILELIHLPNGYLEHLRTRRSLEKKDWERFVAVRASNSQAEAMTPVITAHTILVIDRHYTSFMPYHPQTPNLYAVQRRSEMVFRYVTFQSNWVILRPHKIEAPVELIDLKPGELPTAMIVGRICASISGI